MWHYHSNPGLLNKVTFPTSCNFFCIHQNVQIFYLQCFPWTVLNRTVGRSIIGNSYQRMSCISIALPPPGPSSCWNRQAQCSQVCCSPVPKSRLLHPNCQTLEVWFITPENMCPLLWSPVLYTTACKTFHVRLGCSLTWVSWSAMETRSVKLSMCCSRANLEAFIPRRFHFVILTDCGIFSIAPASSNGTTLECTELMTATHSFTNVLRSSLQAWSLIFYSCGRGSDQNTWIKGFG